jgi:hypothetical protein
LSTVAAGRRLGLVFRWIHDLITEHGSAAILRERIAQLQEQMAIRDAKIADLQREKEALVGAKEKLQAQMDVCQRDKGELQRQHDELKRRTSATAAESVRVRRRDDGLL